MEEKRTMTKGSGLVVAEFVSKVPVDDLIDQFKPPSGINRGTFGVMLGQFATAGILKVDGKQGRKFLYRATTDSFGMSPQDILSLWREAIKTPKTAYKKHKTQSQPEPPPEPEPAPEVTVDLVQVFRHVFRQGGWEHLVQAAREEFGTSPEETQESNTLQERILALEAELTHARNNVTGLHEANRRLREEQFNDRKRLQELRAELNARPSGTKIIERIVRVGPIPPGSQSGSSGGYAPAHTMRMHSKPPPPSAGGMATVSRKKHK